MFGVKNLRHLHSGGRFQSGGFSPEQLLNQFYHVIPDTCGNGWVRWGRLICDVSEEVAMTTEMDRNVSSKSWSLPTLTTTAPRGQSDAELSRKTHITGWAVTTWLRWNALRQIRSLDRHVFKYELMYLNVKVFSRWIHLLR